jgi:DNA topoisomerase-3
LKEFAGRILQNGVNPRNGTKSDQAHPPIHPIKYANELSVCVILLNFVFKNLIFILKGKEQTVYEFIVRHFLACCSADAKGMETTITIEVNQEKVIIYSLFIFINI